MDPIALVFWGAYLGVAMVIFLAAFIPLAHGLPRVALLLAGGPVLGSCFLVAVLGWTPGSDETQLRTHSVLALLGCASLSAMMFLLLRTRRWIWQAWSASNLATLLVAGGIWLTDARTGIIVVSAYCLLCCVATTALLLSPRGLRDDRLAWLALGGTACIAVIAVTSAWIALHRESTPWPIHGIAAFFAIAHQLCSAAGIWSRFSHLAELRLVRAFGSGYDPVTRMRALENAGQFINSVFAHRGTIHVGVMAVTVANLYALENLHGRAVLNQALFVLANRLRRSVPGGVQLGRLGPDVFLILTRRSASDDYLVDVARHVRELLVKPINLGTSEQPSEVRLSTREWCAAIGIGVMAAPPELGPAAAVNLVRGMSRAALAYESGIARQSGSQVQMA